MSVENKKATTIDEQVQILQERGMVIDDEKNFLDKDDERNDHFLLKFNKAVIGYQSGKQVSKMYTDIIVVEMLKAAVARVVKKNHDNHDLRIGHGRLAMIFAF